MGELYHSARWRELRELILKRDLYTCQMLGCGRIEKDTSKLVADHKIPHKGMKTSSGRKQTYSAYARIATTPSSRPRISVDRRLRE